MPISLPFTCCCSVHLSLTVQDKLVRTVVANYVLWPAAHFINFKFVPGQHRVLYNNCVSVSMFSRNTCVSAAPAFWPVDVCRPRPRLLH